MPLPLFMNTNIASAQAYNIVIGNRFIIDIGRGYKIFYQQRVVHDFLKISIYTPNDPSNAFMKENFCYSLLGDRTSSKLAGTIAKTDEMSSVLQWVRVEGYSTGRGQTTDFTFMDNIGNYREGTILRQKSTFIVYLTLLTYVSANNNAKEFE